ncbi:MAG TPA: CvpA family protein [Ramlibacter sp.]|nr:CvpA family protein [Ramlibacter sp.]
MAALDWVFLAVLAFSVLLGGWRGLVYEVLSVAGWVAAFVLAQWFAPDVAAWLPMGESAQPLRYAAAFVLVFIAGAFAAGLLAWLAKKLIDAVGLRPIDRVLGAAFGLVRGVVIVLAVAVVFHMTPLKETAMWNESAGAPLATATLKGLKPILPEGFGRYLPG